MTKRAGRLVLALAAVLACAAARGGDAEPETDSEIWNRGVELYRAGNATNALAVLKPLVLSKTHGARASELVGAIEFAEWRKRSAEDAGEALRSLESAAVDFQTALRSNPKDARMNRNFTRASDRLPELRERARIEKAMKELGKQDPAGLLGNGVREARSVMREFPVALTNDARAAIAKCEAMSKRMEKLCDTWIAVKSGVAQSVTNEQQAMTITAQVDEARAATEEAAKALGDLDPSAQSSLSVAESALTRFLKMAILPPGACGEAILAQTNSLTRAETVNGREWCGEAIDYMHAFKAKFPQWAQAYAQKAQSDTNMPPFTAEAQAEVAKLADETLEIQEEIVKMRGELKGTASERRGGGKDAEIVAKEFRALEKMNKIRELLPKDKNGGGGSGAQNQNQDNQQNDKNQDKNDDKDQDKSKEGQEEDKPQDAGEDDKQDGQDEKKEEPKPEEQNSGEEQKDDRQVEDVLRKAQERSDQHEADKKARMRNMPLPANDRDW